MSDSNSRPNPAQSAASQADLGRLDPGGSDGEFLIVIETPKGSRNKFKWEPKFGAFSLSKVLPIGAVFPFDFGFVPSTLAEDGDPIDVLLLMDEPAFTGCLATVRLIGVVEAEQTEKDGKKERNDRLVGVAAESRDWAHVRTLDDLGDGLVTEIEHFFVSYHQISGSRFEPKRRLGPDDAVKLVREGIDRAKQAARR